MARYAFIEPTTDAEGNVVNVIVAESDQLAQIVAPPNVTLIKLDDGAGMGVGDIYDFNTGEYFRPVPPDPEVDAEGYVLNQDGSRMTDSNEQWITALAYFGGA